MKQLLVSIFVAIVSALVTAGYLTQNQWKFIEEVVVNYLSWSAVVIETGSVATGSVYTGEVATGILKVQTGEVSSGPILDME